MAEAKGLSRFVTGVCRCATYASTASTQLYHSPVVQCPSAEELTKLSKELRLNCSTEDIKTIENQFHSFASALQRLAQLPQPSLPVKYPRTPGFKPDKGDNPHNAWIWRCDIKGADTGKLAGKTIGIKDNIPVAGVPLMNGSKVLEGYTPEFDATVVTRILDAGARITGKTSCEHMCFTGSSFSGDNGPVTNPHDPTRTSGGSSSGSAVVVELGLADMAMGGDQGGSIRVPASWSGIVGLKPTFGLVPYTGVLCMEPSLDHLGPMTKTVSDCALLLEVIAGYDEGRDTRQHPQTIVPEYSKLLDAGVSGKKIGVLKEGFDVCKERDVIDIVKREVERLKDAGAVVEEVSIPLHLDGPVIWTSVTLQGSVNCMIKGNGAGFFRKGYYPLSTQEAAFRGHNTRPQDMSGSLKTFLLWCEYLGSNYQNKFYAMGHNMTMVLTKAYDSALEKYDVLVMPTCPYKATKMPAKDASLSDLLHAGMHMFPNTAPFNSTGHPALSINAGFSDGLPVGMEIVGRHFDETTILQVARAYEKLRDQE